MSKFKSWILDEQEKRELQEFEYFEVTEYPEPVQLPAEVGAIDVCDPSRLF